jgi:hypothetical protein
MTVGWVEFGRRDAATLYAVERICLKERHYCIQ